MKSARRLLVATVAMAGLMALTTTSNAVGPGYGPDSPAREGVNESRENRDQREGATGGAPGGATDQGSGCARKGSGGGSGTGGSLDTGQRPGEGSGAGRDVAPVTGQRPGNGA